MTTAEILSKFPDARRNGVGWKAKCPSHDDSSPSLTIAEGDDGRTLLKCFAGCSVESICEKVGIKLSDLFRERPPERNGSPAKSKSAFDWQQCVGDFTDAEAQRLADWRGLSLEFVQWLHRQGAIGLHQGKPAFPVYRDSRVVACHWRVDDRKWNYFPSGVSVTPLIFGDVRSAGYVLTFESQWDAFAVMDKLGWHAGNGLSDTAILITRGGGNGKLAHGQFSPDGICYAFAQNDKPGEKWLAEIARTALCKTLAVLTPAPHKDPNDWTRAGASKSDIERGIFREARPVKIESAELKSTESSGDFTVVTAEVRGDILAALADKNTTPTAQRQKICERVVSALVKVGRFYFHAELRDFDSALFFNGYTKRLERIRADCFASWLSDWLVVNRAAPLFRFIMAAVETASLSGANTTAILPEFFWASRPGAIYISNGDGALVKITATGFELASNGTDGVLFAAGQTCQPWELTAPQDIFQTCRIFREAHTTAGHAPDLLRAWTYSLPSNPRCKPPLLLVGDIGAGKTAQAKAIAGFFGLVPSVSKVEEITESNFWPCINDGGIYCLDNADTKTNWLADTIAAAATDGSSKRRKLYSDADTVILRPRAWLILTSANPSFAADAGLADRLLVVRMSRRDDCDTGDAVLADEIATNRSAGLSHLAATLSKALADIAPTPPRLNARHPDFAAFAVKIGRALGRESEMVAALKTAESDKSAFCLENDFIGSALLNYLNQAAQFTGTANELREKLIESDAEISGLAEHGKFSAKRLGKRLSALMPHLRQVLQTATSEQNRNKVMVFSFRTAGFAGFQSVVSDKPLREEIT